MMRMKMLACLTAAAMIAPGPARADDASVHNVQCFLASSLLAASDDQATKTAGMMAAMFFAGKIFGTDPDIDLTGAAIAELPSLNEDRIKVLRAECGAEMMERGKQISATGDALKEEAGSDGTT